MIQTTALREEESSKRLFFRSAVHTLERVVAEGTSCSAFEAAVIAEKAPVCLSAQADRKYSGWERIMKTIRCSRGRSYGVRSRKTNRRESSFLNVYSRRSD